MEPSLLLALVASCSEFLGHRGLPDFFVCRVPVVADWCHGTSVEVFNAKNDSCRLQQWIPWYWDDNLKEDDNAGIDGGVGWICFKWPAFHNLRQGGCNIPSEGKANQRWDVDASKVVSFESSIQRCVFNKMSLDVKDFTNWHFESLKWVVSRIWVGRLFDTWAVRVGPFHGIIVAQNRGPYLFWYAHRSWTEFSMFRGDADRAIDVSRNAIHAPRLSRAQARVKLLPSKSCGLRPTGFDNGSQEERKRWPRLSLVTHEPRQVRKRVKNQKPKLISPFLSPNLKEETWMNCFLGCATDFWWSLAFGDTSTSCFCLDFS